VPTLAIVGAADNDVIHLAETNHAIAYFMAEILRDMGDAIS
jgi:hypothetical protein